MKRLATFLPCAVADTDKNYAYYCEVADNRDVWVGYGSPADTRGLGYYFTISDRIWRQGPRGGVKIIKDIRKDNWGQMCGTQYVTRDQDLMKEFLMVKIRAVPLSYRK